MRIALLLVIVIVVLIIAVGLYNQYSIEARGNPPGFDPGNPILRTPDERFSGLVDFNYEPRYLTIRDTELGELRVHYLDEGPTDGEVIVLLHGQATWSYSYRDMIPLLTQAGYRVIAPDLIGFGRSDKPADWQQHTFQKHVEWLEATLQGLNISNATGFFFDWGGYFGLRVVVDKPDIFSRIVLVTTLVPRGEGLFNAGWVAWWRRHVLGPEVFPISAMVNDMTDNDLAQDTLVGLDAPYPDEVYKAGPRRFPMMIPATFLHPASTPNREAWDALAYWDKPTLTLVSERLAQRGFNPEELHKQIPGARGQAHTTYPDTGFFLIEDAPQALAEKTIEFIQANPD